MKTFFIIIFFTSINCFASESYEKFISSFKNAIKINKKEFIDIKLKHEFVFLGNQYLLEDYDENLHRQMILVIKDPKSSSDLFTYIEPQYEVYEKYPKQTKKIIYSALSKEKGDLLISSFEKVKEINEMDHQ